MKRVVCFVAITSFLALGIASAKPVRPSLEPVPPPPPRPVRDLVGTYMVAYSTDVKFGNVVHLKIWNQRGNTFNIGIAERTGSRSMDWEGQGIIDGDRGHYDWVFRDGKAGRTTFTIDKNGIFHGQVRGGGIDWDYIARRADKVER